MKNAKDDSPDPRSQPSPPRSLEDKADEFRDSPSLEDLGYIENPHGGPPVMPRTKADFEYCRKHGIRIPDDWKPEPEEKEESGALGCPRCLATPTNFDELPLERVVKIVDRSHESLNLCRCKHCGQLFGKYDIEILLGDDDEDLWTYWVPVTDAEAQTLQTKDGCREIVNLIKSRKRLVCNPQRQFYWKEGDFDAGLDLTPPG